MVEIESVLGVGNWQGMSYYKMWWRLGWLVGWFGERKVLYTVDRKIQVFFSPGVWDLWSYSFLSDAFQQPSLLMPASLCP